MLVHPVSEVHEVGTKIGQAILDSSNAGRSGSADTCARGIESLQRGADVPGERREVSYDSGALRSGEVRTGPRVIGGCRNEGSQRREIRHNGLHQGAVQHIREEETITDIY